MEGSWDAKKRAASGEDRQTLAKSKPDHEGVMKGDAICNETDLLETELKGNKFSIGYSKSGKAKCKNCSKLIGKDSLRIGKLVPFKDTHIHQFYHLTCAFELFKRARVASNIISKVSEVDGVENITEAEKSNLEYLITQSIASRS